MEATSEVRLLAQPLADEEGYELVDVEVGVRSGRRTLRILLDKPGGVTVGDCARFSRRMSDCLDMNQTMQGRYDLEVGSPGIERPIRTIEAVERFAGQRAVLTTHELREGRRHYDGELLGPRDGRAGIKTEDGDEHWFDWSEVKSVHLVVDPWARRRGAKESR